MPKEREFALVVDSGFQDGTWAILYGDRTRHGQFARAFSDRLCEEVNAAFEARIKEERSKWWKNVEERMMEEKEKSKSFGAVKALEMAAGIADNGGTGVIALGISKEIRALADRYRKGEEKI